MYIYHVLINALSAHMIHINLNMIFYTHVKHSPTKTIYIKYYKHFFKHTLQTHTHTDCSRNWVLILVRMEILWEEEGFQFGFKRWQGWAVSKVLWEWIPNVGSKAREGVKAVSLAFVLLDFQHVGVRRRAQCTRRSVFRCRGADNTPCWKRSLLLGKSSNLEVLIMCVFNFLFVWCSVV